MCCHRITCYALFLILAIGCGADRSSVKSEAELDLQAVSSAFNFIESVLNTPMDDKMTLGKKHISEVKMSEAMALKAFRTIQHAKNAMLRPFGEEAGLEHIRLFLFDQFSEKSHGSAKHLPAVWVVLPESGIVMTEDVETDTIDQFLVTLQEELSRRTDAKEISNLEKQIEFLRAIP